MNNHKRLSADKATENLNSNKVIVISSNYAWTIFNFRMNLIKRLKKEGFKIIVFTQFDGYEIEIKKEVDVIKNLYISRKGINPLIDLITLFHFIKTFIIFKPSNILLFTIKPVIYGSIAARLTNINSIPMITGLGTLFITNTWLTKIAKRLYKIALKSTQTILFQNEDDMKIFVDNKLVESSSCIITPGSGINLEKFKQRDIPNEKNLKFLFVGRLIKDKGIREFVDAARIIKKKFPNVDFQVLGPVGSENRSAIKQNELEEWKKEKVIEYLGETDDTLFFLNRATCIVLPSYREGTSRALLEAAAVGRPLIAADVPGCREIVDDLRSGYLCKVRDYLDLADKIEKMIMLPHESRLIMGMNSRLKVEKEYDENIVLNLFINEINKDN